MTRVGVREIGGVVLIAGNTGRVVGAVVSLGGVPAASVSGGMEVEVDGVRLPGSVNTCACGFNGLENMESGLGGATTVDVLVGGANGTEEEKPVAEAAKRLDGMEIDVPNIVLFDISPKDV